MFMKRYQIRIRKRKELEDIRNRYLYEVNKNEY